jgi:hypothetical protein
MNRMVDFIIGLVPLVGDFADTLYKATQGTLSYSKTSYSKGAKAMFKTLIDDTELSQ